MKRMRTLARVAMKVKEAREETASFTSIAFFTPHILHGRPVHSCHLSNVLPEVHP